LRQLFLGLNECLPKFEIEHSPKFYIMAKNKPYGDGARKGAVKNRSQVLNPKTKLFVTSYLLLCLGFF